MATGENGTLIDDVGVIANTECFTNVVVGNQYTDTSFFQKADDSLDLDDGDRIDAGKRFIQQNKAGIGCQCTGDFDAPAFTARERER